MHRWLYYQQKLVILTVIEDDIKVIKNSLCVGEKETVSVFPWALVVGGLDGHGAMNRVELISLDPTGAHPVPECHRKRSNFPDKWPGPVGYSNNGENQYRKPSQINFPNDMFSQGLFLCVVPRTGRTPSTAIPMTSNRTYGMLEDLE